MNGKLYKSFLLVFFLSVSAAFSFAQTVKTMPFGVGETLTYEGKFSKIIKGIGVADLSLKIERADDGKNYLIKSEARSKGSLLKLFRFSFFQQFSSTIDAERFRILKTVKRDTQKERVRDSEAVFDYDDRRVTYVETDPLDPARPPRTIASGIPDNTHDLISAIYSLRLLPLAVGRSFEVYISDSGLLYKIPVRVTAREQQKSILGKMWCFRVEPEVFGMNRLIEKEGDMTIWITDDDRRLPVRAQINSDLGRIEVKLKTASGLK
ncbi:MAG TPA: DUF3108 domain-containing protein [Pyrinomonadaceae bacterium]|jgi:hypothetical protein